MNYNLYKITKPTEEMFQQMTDHLSRQAEAGQGWQAEAAPLPAMQRNHMPAAGAAGGPGGMGAGWGGTPQADPGAAGLDAMVNKIETELGQGRSMMDMMDDLDLDAL